MAIKIISHKRLVEEVDYHIFYEWVEELDAGFMFPCNEHGEIDFDSMSKEALANYEKCDSEEYAVVYRGLQREVNKYTEPAVGECSCSKPVTLATNSNQCECGQWYNAMGQQLTDPKEWGEETDEHYTDILREM
jgi:hypothetical protein